MENLEQQGVVSLWVFREPEDPADAGMDVLKDFCGVEYYDIDSQEGVLGDHQQPLHALLGQLSYSGSFDSNALSAAEHMGIKEGYGVLAQFDFAYDPGKITKRVRKDPVFIGYFEWRH